MEASKLRVYSLDEDQLEVIFHYHETYKQYFGAYPDFVENPRFTPNGKPWVNVTNVGCPYAEKDFNDCGSCRFFRQERPGDLIGICENEHYCGKIPFVER